MVEDVAVLTIDNPPVNMGNATLRRDLYDALGAAGPDVVGVVIIGAGRHFYAGSDISEFDGPLIDPQLPAVIEVIESLPVPVVAAISGLALGGGLELALGCDGRIGATSARLGFPEVTLGILPGAGGTVRAARLLGVPTAIDLVASARQVDADEALELGLLDHVVPAEDLLARAVDLARSLAGKSRLRDRSVPHANPEQVEEAVARHARKARPNVLEAVGMVRRSAEVDAGLALSEERAIFERLRVSEEAANLRYLFFAKRAAAKALRGKVAPRPVRTVGIAGAGTMGAALARACSGAGYRVVLFDTNPAALARVAGAMPGLTTTETVGGLAGADLVVDAVFEDMDVKRDLFAEVERHVAPGAVLATNTSYLDINEMSRSLEYPRRFGGLHFFNPPDRNPLVELIRAETTDDVTAATLADVVKALGKTGIPAGVGDGFVANRVYADYRTQAEFLVEEGATPEQVDAAMVQLGLAIGPFAVADMSGLDIAWARRKRIAPTRDPLQRYVDIPDRLCEAGRLGRKTGAGWYGYPDGARRGLPDPDAVRIIEEARATKGIAARSIDDGEIRARILASMLCAAVQLMESGVAQRASDIDVALTEGFAFPRATGGPLRLLSRWEEDDVIAALTAAYRSCRVTFALAEPATRGELPQAVRAVLRQVAPHEMFERAASR